MPRPFLIQAGDVNLEAIWHPAHDEIARCVVAHPHPQFGGSMNNNVVDALCEILPMRGVSALRFNFRGVGRSSGSFGGGEPEAGDLLACVRYLAEETDVKVFVAGYSFGAAVACIMAEQTIEAQAYALISPPVGMFDVRYPDKAPTLVLAGDRDPYGEPESVRALAEKNTLVSIIPDVDHFWVGSEELMAHKTADFLVARGH